MKRYLLYSNLNTGEHIMERHVDNDVLELRSEKGNGEWNNCMSRAHALFRLAHLVKDKEASAKMLKDLDDWFGIE